MGQWIGRYFTSAPLPRAAVDPIPLRDLRK